MRTRSWRQLLVEAATRLRAAGVESPEVDARRIGEEASGRTGAALVLHIDGAVTEPQLAQFEAMVARRVAGEPLQYVLGRWGFRTLDLLVDRRVLIPRPETEQVVEAALGELERVVHSSRAGGDRVESTSNRRRAKIVDLGCGSGAIGLSIAAECEGVDVWCVDASADAIAVCNDNLAALDLARSQVTVVHGSWFDALPPDLTGQLDLVIANPPYVATYDDLPDEVADWEPTRALVAGPTGLEAIAHIVDHAPEWLSADGVLVSEIGATQARQAGAAARRAGFLDVEIRPDLAGRDRTLIARRT
ncbi:MAG: peptide chain release factor N(5)-glutamine methyltransferase [Actinomycetota bacterium]|nr:peptide chain release factor N(5)-glutamine methyltransferase [Actinomycetota bacterium]